jgi:hypothetical protein
LINRRQTVHQQTEQKEQSKMQHIEIWPKEFEFGDVEIGGIRHAACRAIDPESGITVTIYLNEEARAKLARDVPALFARVFRKPDGEARH